MRGLKQNFLLAIANCIYVASFTDAWIETPYHAIMLHVGKVASFTDAWIETPICPESRRRARVASFTDAWIETQKDYRRFWKEFRRIFYRCVD